jgi:hypothetical protein
MPIVMMEDAIRTAVSVIARESLPNSEKPRRV